MTTITPMTTDKSLLPIASARMDQSARAAFPEAMPAPISPRPATRRLAVFAVLLLAACIPVGCSKSAPPPSPPPPAVTVTEPLDHEVADWDEYTGHLQSPQAANVAARISGFLTETPFKEGSLVRQGDVLFVLDDRPFKADLDNKRATVTKDEAQVTLTKAQLARYEDLLKKHAISQQDYDTNKANYEQSVAQVAADKAATETAQLNLDWTRVTAPISGRVGRLNVTVGNLVNGGAGQATLLTSVVSVDPMYCYVPVPERAFLKYQTYAARDKQAGVRDAKIPCYVRLENETTFPHAGIIDFIDNSLDTGTGTILLRGVIPNSDGALTPGLFASMRINGGGPYRTLLVPDLAIGTQQNERFLLVVEADGTVASRKIKLGLLFGKLRSVVDGLKPHDRVVINGLQMAIPGTKVNPKEEPIPEEDVRALEALASGSTSIPPSARRPIALVPNPADARP
jgi:membrane fusion protein, multidrug efflux system